MNKSDAGKNAQEILKKRVKTEAVKFDKIQKNLLTKEREIISKKKLISKEEYAKEVNELRKKVAQIQQNKQKSINEVGKLRAKAKKELLNKLSPILKKYLESKNIRIVIDKKEVLYGDASLDITDEIMTLFNKEVKSLDLK